MPDSARKKAEEEKEDDDSKGEEDDNQMIPNSSLGNVAIPLANGNILKIPVNKFNAEPDQCHINITEQLAKSGTWKSIDQSQKSKTNKENKAALKESKEKDKSTG